VRNTKLLFGSLALAGIGLGVSACTPPTTSAGPKPADSGVTAPASVAAVTGTGSVAGSGAGSGSPVTQGSGAGVNTGPGSYILAPMPAGTVQLERGQDGHLQAQVEMFGLTPGSSHAVSIQGPFGHRVGFPALTANSAGQADTTLTSNDRVRWLPPLSRFVVRLGTGSGDPLAAERIAETSVLPPRPEGGGVFAFHAVTFDTNGASFGRPAGRATLSYDSAAQTLTITVTAYGLNPGPHAAHIHLGSCQNQGPVKYMLADFTADANGDIIDQTRVVSGVTSVPAPGNWYLNLHQGGMNQILANGMPTLNFRPMLCTDITTFATAGSTPSGSPSASPSPSSSVSPSPAMPTGSPTMTMPTGAPSSSASSSPSGNPTAMPTHW